MLVHSYPPALLDFQNVSVMRNSHLALNRISLRIEPGEHAAILGANGSGKSTLIKTIARECYPLIEEGSALSILGRDRWNIFELRSMLGIVSADPLPAWASDITGEEAVISGFFSSVGVWPNHEVTPQMRDCARATLERLEAAHLADRSITAMSSGEARRVLIGRALAHNPKALLLDEPSTSLDLRAQRELAVLLSRLAREGVGILLVTHHLSDIIPEIDRVILLRNGRVMADGSKREILTETKLSELFEMPVTLARRDGYYHLW